MTRKSAIRHSTPTNRSVFRDLGFDEAEAKVLEMRADLMAALREHIKERGWTQSKAAKELGITQPRVSALVKGVLGGLQRRHASGAGRTGRTSADAAACGLSSDRSAAPVLQPRTYCCGSPQAPGRS
jgi:predicted XRE-type DNA-binding protein